MKDFIMSYLDTYTHYGEIEKKKIKIYKKKNSDLLIKELNYLETMISKNKEQNIYISNIEYEFCKLKSIVNTIKKLENNTLDEVELFEIKNFAISSQIIKENYEKLNVYIDYINLVDIEEIIKILDPSNLKLTTFQIYDSYSQNLKEIRISKQSIEKEIFKEKNLENIKALKEKRLEIVIKEEKEENKIKEEISKKISKYIHALGNNICAIGKLDLLNSKAKFCIKHNLTKPNINNQNKIVFEELRNLELMNILKDKNKEYIPISIDLDKKVTLLTGANMGGKSVSMKATALNLYLFQCGFYVFAKSANLCILDFIYFISQDLQDIDKGLSTFGGEIIKLKEIINLMKKEDGFIALDEFAKGTNPVEGKILLKSICDYFNKFNSISLISTHYDEEIENVDHYQVIGLKNVNFEKLKYKIDLNKSKGIKILQENMDYRLEKVNDKKVPKDALNICSLLGLDKEVLDIAKKYYQGENDE